MLVSCKGCKKKIDRDSAFKVTVNNKNNYYCNEDEYNEIQIEKESRLKVINYTFEIIGKTTNTVLMKELNEIGKIHTYRKTLRYLEKNLIDLNILMDRNFNSEYGKIKYFTTILKNQIGDFVEKKNEEIELWNHEFIDNIKYTPTMRKTFDKYIEEY